MALSTIPILSGAVGWRGHAPEFQRDRFGILGRVSREVDDVARLRFPTRQAVLVNSPGAIHEVLVEKARAFEKSPMLRAALYPLAGEGLFTSGGALWRRQRRLMAPLFQHARIDAMAPLMVDCAQRATEGWKDGEVLDAARETTRIAMSIAGRTLFGFDAAGEADAIGHALTVALEWADQATTSLPLSLQVELRLALLGMTSAPARVRRVLDGVAARLEAPILYPTERNRELGKAIALLDDRVQRMIDERRASAAPRDDLLSRLLQSRDEEDGRGMSDKQVRDEILTLFVAGHETTANGLAWSMYLLARHPEAYARARAAVDALEGRAPTMADLGRLEFLERVFKEALRLYPPVYMFARVSIADVVIAGHDIPARNIVVLSPWTVQRRADLWPDPDRFDPDRFLPAAEAARPRGAWIPFSDGPRVCIGAHFALLEAPLVLATLMQRADFEQSVNREIGIDESATLRPLGGVPIRLHLRHGTGEGTAVERVVTGYLVHHPRMAGESRAMTPPDALERVAMQMTSSLNLGEVLAAITGGLVEEFAASLARIWLVAPGESSLQLCASSGLSVRLDGAYARVPFGAFKIGGIATTRKPIRANDIARDDRIADPEWVRRHGLHSFAGYPLLFRDQLVGVLALFGRRALGEVEFDRLGLFANHAAIAIVNARLYSELETLKNRLQAENSWLEEGNDSDGSAGAHGIIGHSAPLLAALRQVDRVAPMPTTVLLLGETGTGKELFARAVHARSPRRDRALVRLNCAAIAPTLVESELFGHEKGAFTGAVQQRLGRFELAHGGTLFLDEIGELQLDAQAKLLRVLQEGEIERIGGSRSISVDVRLIAATNRNLEAEVAVGRFRADLYYRLNVFPLLLPPLRDRREDIAFLVTAALGRLQKKLGKRLSRLTPEAESRLLTYSWPGNVRELQNVVERAAIVAASDVIGIEDLPDLSPSVSIAAPIESETPIGELTRTAPGPSLRDMEVAHIRRVLEAHRWIVEGPEGAAAALGLSPSTLRSRMSKLGIQRPRRT